MFPKKGYIATLGYTNLQSQICKKWAYYKVNCRILFHVTVWLYHWREMLAGYLNISRARERKNLSEKSKKVRMLLLRLGQKNYWLYYFVL